MNKTADRTVALDKGRVDVYTKNGVTLYAYQTRDLIDNEAFVLAKKGRGGAALAIAAIAGIDLSTPDALEHTIAYISGIIDEIAALTEEIDGITPD